MSDEHTSAPTLRLKPRARLENPTDDSVVAASVAAPAPVAAEMAAPVAPVSSPEPVKIRLKPKLTEAAATDSVVTPSEATVVPSTPVVTQPAATIPPVQVEPPANVAPVTPVASEATAEAKPVLRVRLQARPSPSENAVTQPSAVTSSVPPAAAAPAAVATPVVIPAPAVVLVSPIIAAAPTASAAVPADADSNKFKLKPSIAPAPAAPTMIGGIPLSSKPLAVPAAAPAVATPHLKFKKQRSQKPLIAALVVVGLAAGAYFGSDYFSQAAKTAAPKVAAPAAELATSLKQSETLNKLATMPGEMIQKAKDSIAARREQEQSRVDGSAVGEIPAAAAKPVAPPPSAPVPVATSATPVPVATATQSIAPGVTATMKIEAAAEASAEFKEWVANARISGIGPTRVILNDRLVKAGDMADSSLGIRFEGYNRETKQLRFSDRSGAHVVRRY